MKKTILSFCLVLFVFTAGGIKVNAGEAYTRSIYTNKLQTIEEAQRRPIAVMMSTDRAAQPSFGIGNAKILYEIMEEGSISRQMAIIDDWQELEQIGNIRSCRLYYIPVATEWDPILIHFGGVYYMKERITASDIQNLSGTSEDGTLEGKAPGSYAFFRRYGKQAPHNAYIKATGIMDACQKLGYSLTIRPEYYHEKHFMFSESVNTLEQYGKAAIQADRVDFSDIFPYSKPLFVYHEEDGLYYKFIHGMPHTDGLTGEQLTFSNLIIQNTKWQYEPDQRYLDFTIQDDTEDGYFITKGKCIHIQWKKTADYEPTVYYDDYGQEIELNTGKTYIAIAQKGKYAYAQ